MIQFNILKFLLSEDDYYLLEKYGPHAERLANGEITPNTEKDDKFLEFLSQKSPPRTRFERIWLIHQKLETIENYKAKILELEFENRKNTSVIEDLENKIHALTVSQKVAWNKASESEEKLKMKNIEMVNLKKEFGLLPKTEPIPIQKNNEGHVDWWREQS